MTKLDDRKKNHGSLSPWNWFPSVKLYQHIGTNSCSNSRSQYNQTINYLHTKVFPMAFTAIESRLISNPIKSKIINIKSTMVCWLSRSCQGGPINQAFPHRSPLPTSNMENKGPQMSKTTPDRLKVNHRFLNKLLHCML